MTIFGGIFMISHPRLYTANATLRLFILPQTDFKISNNKRWSQNSSWSQNKCHISLLKIYSLTANVSQFMKKEEFPKTRVKNTEFEWPSPNRIKELCRGEIKYTPSPHPSTQQLFGQRESQKVRNSHKYDKIEF